MEEQINQLREAISKFSGNAEEFRLKYMSKKGLIAHLFDAFRACPDEEKKRLGRMLNTLRSEAQRYWETLKDSALEYPTSSAFFEDITCSGEPLPMGSRHPLSSVREEILSIFDRLGFVVSTGPEIEDDYHNFSALNFPEEHPARDMQDTFFIEKDPDILLRTHTSSVQVRDMEEMKVPIRCVVPGRVFRNEAISARAHCIFHQVEALYIDKQVSFADLKQTIDYFAKEFFGSQTAIRLRPSFFPFTEPSAEVDVSCSICQGKGCAVCKNVGWVEVMGCGMVDANVLSLNGLDENDCSGFALGMGIERIAMLRYGIDDLRLFFENDVRFLRQFQSIL